jgi:hypothetical protein
VNEDESGDLAILDDLRRRAIERYGADRAASATLQTLLKGAATAVFRVMREPLAPSEAEP